MKKTIIFRKDLSSTWFQPFILVFIALLTGCSGLGPHSGSVETRSIRLSHAIQNAYAVPSYTADRLSPVIIQSADRYNVPPELIAATIRQESGYRSGLRSGGGAVGLTQIIPSYWAHRCPGDLNNDYTNIQCNAYILSTYYGLAGSWFKASAYYNVGPAGYQSSFWTRHKGKKYARSVRHYKKLLKKAL
ncbi:lytic transglycosylase domain-containing protein [Acinetobacter pollinis]|uniref:Transglycosylase SLT domain-containing protein n=1 Tax=Acinetobacter pollinis TaxID=2605270 RepID=A0ABU6DQF9_9GAMM|nr:lytic transglycosylase domain-containing protein [Acinetobacter pollinis]MBF7689392.1 transglycosylase SLT domain-containing protein [Acinetobacter pollinis]MBF7692039.1 transglycosylase SLT domain-containing protein [Acinetobacter pollinis]MBF7697013.1 transglycosylase SLT domain-containing protein [Acinetobacter pollinis]MBF7700404.1 transglycosylase SLT domain-containing protein [Acinetobacter pollinis]MEB5476096.1 transglycosylase SLT domain-containing protein [Acinetobacter pollinis]